MATVVAVSSFVARGAVGLRAIVPALDRLGHDAIACPTIVLSNHLGHARAAGSPVAPETLAAMIDALADNGWLAGVDAVLTGYLPSPEHVHLVERLITRVRAARAGALIVCDPVLGDDPGGLYVPESVAEAVRDRLVPLATHMKVNTFELALLSGRGVSSVSGAVDAARRLAAPVVLASSVPSEGGGLANVIVTRERASRCTVAEESDVPHGTGDLLAATFVGHLLHGEDPFTSTALAAAAVARAIALSRGRDELQLFAAAAWHEAAALTMTGIDR